TPPMALQWRTDEHLQKTWKLKARGQVVAEAPRYVMLQDSINHLAHHRGQLTVYLRLNEGPVPAIYRPSADEQRFWRAGVDRAAGLSVSFWTRQFRTSATYSSFSDGQAISWIPSKCFGCLAGVPRAAKPL